MDNKKYIHIVSSEVMPILDLFPGGFTEKVQSTLSDLVKILAKYGIKYEELRSVLNPSANAYAFVFDADLLAESVFGNYIDHFKPYDKKMNPIFDYQKWLDLFKKIF